MQGELRLWLTYIEDPEESLTEEEIKEKLNETIETACNAIMIKHASYWKDVEGESILDVEGSFEFSRSAYDNFQYIADILERDIELGTRKEDKT